MRCTKCGKPTNEYVPNTKWCRTCKNAKDRELYQKNKLKYKEAQEREPDKYKLGNYLCFLS